VHVLVAGVVVEVEADLVAVEGDRAVDVADGEDDHLERPVHLRASFRSAGAGAAHRHRTLLQPLMEQ